MDLRDIERAFFDAKSSKYAPGAKNTTIPQLPGSIVTTVQVGEYRVVYFYYIPKGYGASPGMITIWHRDRPNDAV